MCAAPARAPPLHPRFTTSSSSSTLTPKPGLASRLAVHTLAGAHSKPVVALAIRGWGDAFTLYSGSWDKRVQVWRFRGPYPPDPAKSVLDQVLPGIMMSATGDIVADPAATARPPTPAPAPTPAPYRTLQGHTDAIWAVAVAPNGTVYTGANDKTVRIW